MLIRDHYRDPAALGNEQVLTLVGSGVERKEGLGEEEEGIKRVTGRQVGSRGFMLQLPFCVGRALHWAPGLSSLRVRVGFSGML